MAHAESTELGTSCEMRQPLWVTRSTRRRRARGREAKQVACVKEVSPIMNSIDSVLEWNYALHFPTINETGEKGIDDSVLVKKPSVHQTIEPRSQSPSMLFESPESCSEIIEKLDRYDRADQHELLQWLKKGLRKLALSKHGSRVVQKAFEVATGSDRDAMIHELADHIVELYESPHGNHVLSKAIETLPAAKTNFIISAFLGRGVTVSKHRFGCRIVCRLIEHAGEDQIQELMGELVENIETLAKLAYGNYVVGTILEHAMSWRRCAISRLLAVFPSLCVDRSGSLVAQKIVDSPDEDMRNAAIDCLNRTNLVEVACSRYGSYVVEEIAKSCSPAALRSASILADGIAELQHSEYAQRVIEGFHLLPNEAEAGKLEGGQSALA